MNSFRLSFCMPTYNYGRFIGTAIDSILRQAPGGVEVIVLDGGSTDDTREVVTRLAEKNPALKYFRQETRGGIDTDLARSVELATGDYCWLLSADDALCEGALPRMLSEIGEGNDIILCNRIWCDGDLHPVRAERWLAGGDADRIVSFSDERALADYLGDARSLGALFSFMSSIVFRRAAWAGTPGDPGLIGLSYAHAYRLFEMGRRGGRMKYLAAPLVMCRGGADSFRAGGLAARLLIDLRGHQKLAETLFPGKAGMQALFLEVLKREHPWWRWVRVRAEARDPAQWREVSEMMRTVGYSRSVVAAAASAGAGLSLLRRAMGD